MEIEGEKVDEKAIGEDEMEIKTGRCFFCHGNISEGRCIMCGRSTDIKHEKFVQEAQKKPHENWHTNEAASQKASHAKRSNPNGYGRREEK